MACLKYECMVFMSSYNCWAVAWFDPATQSGMQIRTLLAGGTTAGTPLSAMLPRGDSSLRWRRESSTRSGAVGVIGWSLGCPRFARRGDGETAAGVCAMVRRLWVRVASATM